MLIACHQHFYQDSPLGCHSVTYLQQLGRLYDVWEFQDGRPLLCCCLRYRKDCMGVATAPQGGCTSWIQYSGAALLLIICNVLAIVASINSLFFSWLAHGQVGGCLACVVLKQAQSCLEYKHVYVVLCMRVYKGSSCTKEV